MNFRIEFWKCYIAIPGIYYTSFAIRETNKNKDKASNSQQRNAGFFCFYLYCFGIKKMFLASRIVKESKSKICVFRQILHIVFECAILNQAELSDYKQVGMYLAAFR